MLHMFLSFHSIFSLFIPVKKQFSKSSWSYPQVLLLNHEYSRIIKPSYSSEKDDEWWKSLSSSSIRQTETSSRGPSLYQLLSWEPKEWDWNASTWQTCNPTHGLTSASQVSMGTMLLWDQSIHATIAGTELLWKSTGFGYSDTLHTCPALFTRPWHQQTSCCHKRTRGFHWIWRGFSYMSIQINALAYDVRKYFLDFLEYLIVIG